MAANRGRVLARVTEMLNLVEPSTYSATISPRNKTRNQLAIADFTDEAGLQILKAIAERPNEFRYQLLTTSGAITVSGDPVPPHLGPLDSVRITPYTGADPVEAERRDYRKIQSYRQNPSKVYDAKDHNVAGSSLAGYYDVWSDKFYFTGLSAVIKYARLPVRADTATLIPEVLENVWIRLAMGEAAKVGTGGFETAIIDEYGKRGVQDLIDFKNGSRQFVEVDDPKPTSAVHRLT